MSQPSCLAIWRSSVCVFTARIVFRRSLRALLVFADPLDVLLARFGTCSLMPV